MRTHKYCPHCYRQLKRTRLRKLGYSFECVYCDEDFFRVEVLSVKTVKIYNPKFQIKQLI